MLVKLFEDYSEDLASAKETIIIKAIETDNANVVDFLSKKGYNNDPEYNFLENATGKLNVFNYFLKKGVDDEQLNNLSSFSLRSKNIQKALLDNGYDSFLKDKIGIVGLHPNVKNDPKYKVFIDTIEGIETYNL